MVLICFIRCHLGNVIKYDTVSKLNWGVDIRNHAIRKVVEYVLAEDWELPTEGNPGRQVPELSNEDDCVVSCFYTLHLASLRPYAPGLLQLGVWGLQI